MYPLLVVAALVFHKKKLLITQRPPQSKHGGYWEFPGGKLEANEAPFAALQRELREEIGLTIEHGEVLDIVYHRDDCQPVLLMFYACQSATDRIEHREVNDHAWIDIEQLEGYAMLPADRDFIARLPELLGNRTVAP